MATLGAVHSVGESMIRHLTEAHQLQTQIEAPLPVAERSLPPSTFEQVSSAQLSTNFAPNGNQLTLYLYRVGIDKHLRTAGDARTPGQTETRPLGLELHYLMTAWAPTPAAEHTLLSWAMREFHMHSSFDRSRLRPTALWRPEEVVHITPSEMPHEDMMRIWDALNPSYRLTVSYVARVVRIDALPTSTSGPVVATRFNIEAHESLVDLEDADG